MLLDLWNLLTGGSTGITISVPVSAVVSISIPVSSETSLSIPVSL